MTTAPATKPAERARPPYVYRGEGTTWYQPLTWNGGRLLARIFSTLFFRLRVYYANRIPPGPVLMVTNHQSFLDPCLVGIGLSRQVHSMARDTLYKGGFTQWLMECWNAFPVKRGAADFGAIRTAVQRLEKGYIINIFPEGTRSTNGSIGPIAPGMSIILNRCSVPVSVVPVVIDGAYDAWPRTSKFPRPHPIRIIHGHPIPSDVVKSLKPAELAVRIRTEMVRLQQVLHSPHAALSAQRLAADSPPAPNRPIFQQ